MWGTTESVPSLVYPYFLRFFLTEVHVIGLRHSFVLDGSVTSIKDQYNKIRKFEGVCEVGGGFMYLEKLNVRKRISSLTDVNLHYTETNKIKCLLVLTMGRRKKVCGW